MAIKHRIKRPEEYEKTLDELNIDKFELKASNVFETKLSKVYIKRLDSSLNEMKKNISKDITAIKMKYLVSKKELESSERKIALKNILKVNKRDKELEPYNELLIIINEYLHYVKEMKEYMDKLE